MECLRENGLFSSECMGTILDTMAEAVFIATPDHEIVYCNEQACRLTGRTEDQLVGKKICSVVPCDCSSGDACLLKTTARSEGRPCLYTGPDGMEHHLIRNARVITGKNTADVLGIVETLTDITVLRKTEERFVTTGGATTSKTHGIVGHSAKMREIYSLLDMASESNVSVLITGETGTGKELAAKAIHASSPRSNGPFVKVNCSALTESLLESELFGHARGSFTGAIKDKIGRFEAADGGTLFLDEIGEISPMIQVKLLRFLQEHEFERVGESVTRRSDVRIVAATHRDLREMVRNGEFREDLFYRLKVFPIHVPSLRERREDIGSLVDHFVGRFNDQTGKKLTGLSREAAIMLMDYCWPGNIRELEHAVEHAFVTCRPGASIDVFDLPVEIRKIELRADICKAAHGEAVGPGLKAVDTRIVGDFRSSRSITRDEIATLLQQYDGNRHAVADALKIDRTTLWRKMKGWGMLAS